MRILFVSPRGCWPAITGAKLREYHFARALGRRASVVYVQFTRADAAPVSREDLPFCERIVSVPMPGRYTPGKVARGLVGKWPLPVLNYTSDEMQSVLLGLLREGRFDLVHLDTIHFAAYEPTIERNAPNAKVIYNWHNIESEVMRRYGASASSFPRRVYASATARRMALVEKRILKLGFGHLVCSERERLEVLREVPKARVAVIENGVDTRFFEERETPAHRDRLVFVGSMEYHANVEAAIFFAQKLWPAIHERFPQWKLTLVGSNPAPGVRALAGVPGVEVTGTVPDVRPYYREAVAAIVPLLTGGGTRLKILEAMAAGVPVVSSPLGAEGLDAIPGENILIAGTDRDWLPAIESLAANQPLWIGFKEAGREFVRARYDWEILGETLYRTYSSWLGMT